MLTDFDALELDSQRRAPFTRIEQERMDAIMAWEATQPSLRRRIAGSLVSLGLRIDPSAAPRPRQANRRFSSSARA